MATPTCSHWRRIPADTWSLPYYGDVLEIWTATHAVGRSSFQLVYQIWRQSDDALIAASHSVQVWLDARQQPTPLPPLVREGLIATLCPDLPKMPARN